MLPFYHMVFPKTLKRLLFLDTDLKIQTDLYDVYSHFLKFSENNLIGVALDQTPHYHHVGSLFRQKYPESPVGNLGKYQVRLNKTILHATWFLSVILLPYKWQNVREAFKKKFDPLDPPLIVKNWIFLAGGKNNFEIIFLQDPPQIVKWKKMVSKGLKALLNLPLTSPLWWKMSNFIHFSKASLDRQTYNSQKANQSILTLSNFSNLRWTDDVWRDTTLEWHYSTWTEWDQVRLTRSTLVSLRWSDLRRSTILEERLVIRYIEEAFKKFGIFKFGKP